MILHGNKRAGAGNLARHLLNEQDNDHVTVHELRGVCADDLDGALREMHATSRGTRCKQFMFSLSLNPPQTESVPTATFEKSIDRIEQHLGLNDQPRAIVFHEKNGRRHAHCVWSRIDAAEMKAIDQPYFKNRLREVSKELFLEHGWNLPPGLINRENRNPLNFTLAEWQQAKRLGNDPRQTKTTLRECWAVSDNRQSFISALEQNGYYLAKGDRRGFVAVDWRGEVYSLSRMLSQKAKVIKMRLGDPSELASVEETKNAIDDKLVDKLESHATRLAAKHHRERQAIYALHAKLKRKHLQSREVLATRQQKRAEAETKARQDRLRHGVLGIWDRVTGRRAAVRQSNEREYYNAYRRDQNERDSLTFAQLAEKEQSRSKMAHLNAQHAIRLADGRAAVLGRLPGERRQKIEYLTHRPCI